MSRPVNKHLTWGIMLGVLSALSFTIEFGVLWDTKSSKTDVTYEAFAAKMSQIAPEINIELKKELKDMNEVSAQYNEWTKTKSGIAVLRSSGAKFLAKNGAPIPSFVGVCNNPADLGVVSNINDEPKKNITGVTYYISAEKQLRMLKLFIPNLKSIALITEKGHPSGPIDQNDTKLACEKLKIDYQSIEIASTNDIQPMVSQLTDKVDAFVLGTQVLVFDNTKMIMAAAGEKPCLSYSLDAVKKGALAGLAADDVKQGEMLAESVVEVLVHKTPVSAVKIKTADIPMLYVNKATLDELGLLVPASLSKTAKYY